MQSKKRLGYGWSDLGYLAVAIFIIAIGVLVSFLRAENGDPSAIWLWHHVLGII